MTRLYRRDTTLEAQQGHGQVEQQVCGNAALDPVLFEHPSQRQSGGEDLGEFYPIGLQHSGMADGPKDCRQQDANQYWLSLNRNRRHSRF